MLQEAKRNATSIWKFGRNSCQISGDLCLLVWHSEGKPCGSECTMAEPGKKGIFLPFSLFFIVSELRTCLQVRCPTALKQNYWVFFFHSFLGIHGRPHCGLKGSEREHISQFARFKRRNDSTNTRGNYSSNDIMRSMFRNFLLMWVGSNAFFFHDYLFIFKPQRRQLDTDSFSSVVTQTSISSKRKALQSFAVIAIPLHRESNHLARRCHIIYSCIYLFIHLNLCLVQPSYSSSLRSCGLSQKLLMVLEIFADANQDLCWLYLHNNIVLVVTMCLNEEEVTWNDLKSEQLDIKTFLPVFGTDFQSAFY